MTPALDALYKDLHEHPELGFKELRTAALLANRMRKLGFEVTEKVGGTGVVAIYRNGDGPTVMVRTDLDGLPMEEKTGLPYASRVKTEYNGKPTFVTHACGHDVHMTWWIGTAEALLKVKDQWHGTLMFVGQPAEELVSGADAMIKDGFLSRFPKPDYGFAAHVSTSPTGTITIKEGAATSAVDGLEIIFKGRGGHGSMPQTTIDPIIEASRFVTDVQTVISREKDPAEFGVVTVGVFQAGSVGNIIPDEARLQLSMRSFSPKVRELLLDGVKRTADASAAALKAPSPEIRHLVGAASVLNDTALTAKTADALRRAGGDEVVVIPLSAPGSSGSEDYSAFVEAGIPSVYMMIGGFDAALIEDYKRRGEPVPSNHSPFFAPDAMKAVKVGVSALSISVISAMSK